MKNLYDKCVKFTFNLPNNNVKIETNVQNPISQSNHHPQNSNMIKNPTILENPTTCFYILSTYFRHNDLSKTSFNEIYLRCINWVIFQPQLQALLRVLCIIKENKQLNM